MSYTPTEKLLARHADGKLIAAKTYEDKIIIVVEDGRKLTYTAEQVEQIAAEGSAKAKAEAEAAKRDKAKK